MVAGLATSFGTSVRLQLKEGRDTGTGLKAELAAESGFEYALRRLTLDSDWNGTGPDGVTLPGGGSFQVSAAGAGEEKTVTVDGADGAGLARYELRVSADPGGSSTGNKAVIALGEEAEFEHCQVFGSVLLADEFGSVKDWHNNADGSGWWGGDGREPEHEEGFEYEFEFAQVHETLWKFTDTTYIGHGTDERVTEEPVKMPPWYLEGWLTPQPGVTVLTDISGLSNQHFSDTVVLVFTHAPEKHKDGHESKDDIHLKNCHFDAGLVVYAPWDTDVRDPKESLGYEIEIEAENCHFGLPGGNHLGVLAPAAEVELENCIVRGLAYGHEIEIENTNLWGVLIGIHEVEVEHGQVFYDADVAQNPPPGVQLDTGGQGVALLEMKERYDD
ncbi:MAG: hypothetical protein D6702_08815 [Planctomycetota bacterium]|nr:MAG: hypothetical protein D6702_08815 [Planctomycetota bacterium]